MNPLSLLTLTAQAGVTLTPALLTLLFGLVASLSALIAGGVAWGKFSAALEQLRVDHAELRADVKKGAADGAQIATMQQSISDLRTEVNGLRQRAHKSETEAATLRAEVNALDRRVGTLADDLRASHHPSPK